KHFLPQRVQTIPVSQNFADRVVEVQHTAVNTEEFDWHIKTFSKVQKLWVKCFKMVAFVKRIMSVLPVALPLKAFVVNKAEFFKLVRFEMSSGFAQKIPQRPCKRVHIEPYPAAPCIYFKRRQVQFSLGDAIFELRKKMWVHN